MTRRALSTWEARELDHAVSLSRDRIDLFREKDLTASKCRGSALLYDPVYARFFARANIEADAASAKNSR